MCLPRLLPPEVGDGAEVAAAEWRLWSAVASEARHRSVCGRQRAQRGGGRGGKSGGAALPLVPLRKRGVALRLPPHSRAAHSHANPHRTTGLKGRNIIAQGKGAGRRPPPWVATPPVALGAAAFLPPIEPEYSRSTPLCLRTTTSAARRRTRREVRRGRASLVPSRKSGVALRLPPHSRIARPSPKPRRFLTTPYTKPRGAAAGYPAT